MMAKSALLILALLSVPGCSRNDPTIGPPLAPRKAAVRAECDGKCCWGMHEYNVPTQCENCGADGIAASHRLCKACATSANLCPHCRGKLTESGTPGAKREEPPTPAPTPEEAPAPQAPPPAVPTPPPQEPTDFRFDEVRGDSLPATEIKPWNHKKLNHPLIVFASRERDLTASIERALKGLPPESVSAGDDAILYVIWGLRAGTVVPEAVMDRKNGRIIVNARWTGTGMMKDAKESDYVAFGFRLGSLDPGTVGVWVRESTPVDKDGPKLTKSITFTVTR